MFERVFHYWKLRALQARKDKLNDEFNNWTDKNKDVTEESKRSIMSELMFELDMLHDLMSEADQDFYTRKGAKLLVRTPPFADKEAWTRSKFSGNWRLTATAIKEYKKEVRAEDKERFDAWSRWIPFISALTGLLGLVVAILALMTKH